jgi:hypothetical protein
MRVRAFLASGFTALALLAAGSASAQQVGGVSITHGGGNHNAAIGFGSYAGQSVATIGGSAGYASPYGYPYWYGGHSVTNGGYNSNVAAGAFSQAHQDVTTIGGSAGYGGKSWTFGGGNHNAALGYGSVAEQQVTTVGGQ